MNKKAKNFFKNLSYTVTANFATLGISILLNLFVPKLLGVTEYSYWQLYVFYSSYVGFLHFGWIDGIYLKIGGENYDDLDKKSLGSQFWYLMLLELFISGIVILGVITFVPQTEQSSILVLTAIESIVVIGKTYVLYIFQSTNRIKEYAQLSRNDRYIYILFLGVYFFTGGRNFYWLIVIDILSKLLMTLWGVIQIKDMVTTKVLPLKGLASDILDNINIGSKLMLSNVASMLILGTIRFFVQHKWSIETFGKLSFTLSISNMFLTFINAVGVVMFPLLRRTNQNKLPNLFIILRSIFVPITYILLLFFVPAISVLKIWLPAYQDSYIYMGILFPIVIYEGRMSLLINTYLKSLRMEKIILIVNVGTLFISALLSLFTIYIFGNLTLSVILILFCLALRCNTAEYFLCKKMKVNLRFEPIFETVLTIIFVLGNLAFNNSLVSLFVYSICLFSYLIMVHRSTVGNLKAFITLLKE